MGTVASYECEGCGRKTMGSLTHANAGVARRLKCGKGDLLGKCGHPDCGKEQVIRKSGQKPLGGLVEGQREGNKKTKS